jgi:hypothetical protein
LKDIRSAPCKIKLAPLFNHWISLSISSFIIGIKSPFPESLTRLIISSIAFFNSEDDSSLGFLNYRTNHLSLSVPHPNP